MARKLKCIMVGVNTGLISAAEPPFGGAKESGMSKEGSMDNRNIKASNLSLLAIYKLDLSRIMFNLSLHH